MTIIEDTTGVLEGMSTHRQWVQWTPSELIALHKHYESSPMAVVRASLPNRSKTQIQTKANQEGLHRRYLGTDRIIYRIDRLLEDTPEALYWLGFLLADGHFSDNNTISVTLSSIDTQHLNKFCSFIGHKPCKPNGKTVGVSTHDIRYAQQIRTKYGIVARKTYNPPPLDIYYTLSDDLFVSLAIGFIDGDGSIALRRKGITSISIHNHNTWMSFQNMIAERLTGIIGISVCPSRLDKAGYANLSAGHTVAKALKLIGQRLSLPMLERKWDKVDTTILTRYEKSAQYRQEVERLYGEGLTKQEIAKQLNLTPFAIKALWQRIRWAKGPKGTQKHQCVPYASWSDGCKDKCRICGLYMSPNQQQND